jgi:HEAT repeat protein
MKRTHRRFGPLFYVTAGITLAVFISRPFWNTASEQWTAWRLSRQLLSTKAPERREAAEKLVQLGPAATSWVIRATRDRDPQVRELACSILLQTMPERPDEALAALLVAARDSDAAVRKSTVTELEHFMGRFGRSADPVVVDRAIRALAEALGDASPQVSLQAAMGLLAAGPKARPAIGALERALASPYRGLRVWAADALLSVDADSTRARVVAAMAPLLKELPMTLEHYKAVEILKRAQGADSTAAILIPLLKDADRQIRMTAIEDLTTHCSDAKALRPAMIEALRSADENMRLEAAVFFLAHEPDMTEQGIDALLEQLGNPTEGAHFGWTLVARLRLVSWSSVKPLTPKLVELIGRSGNRETQAFAIAALGEIRREALAGVPVLIELSNEQDLEIATRAVEALAKIDPRVAATKIPSLMEWMAPGHDLAVRLRAIGALCELGKAATAAMPALLELAGDEDRSISVRAVEAVSKIESRHRESSEFGKPGQ